jgi:hypothetical protein
LAVTSLSLRPHHRRRQRACLASWAKFGLAIASVNQSHELAQLADLYPQVDHWIPDPDPGSGPPRINRLADVASDRATTILLLNSDIEIHGPQSRLLDSMRPNTLVCGIRHNHTSRSKPAQREPWGIDAFVITPAMAQDLPRLPLQIGRPMWDYWLPLHFRGRKYAIRLIESPLFFHKSHPLHWSQDDWDRGAKIVEEFYGEDLSSTSVEFRQSLGD